MIVSSATAVNSPQASEQALSITRLQGETGGGDSVRISFAPPSTAGDAPMRQIGDGVIERLKAFEQTRTEQRAAMNGVLPGPANAVDAAKQALMPGPANIRPASVAEASAAPQGTAFNDAVSAMTRSFDYAIETQLIVKTGSQLSTSASSLMRGQ